MAKLYVSSGRRGRPLSIDPQAELDKLVFQELPQIQSRLASFRKGTSGYRSTAVLGSETELPKFIESTIDVLVDLTEGGKVDYETLRQVRNNLVRASQLSSRQARVYGRAIEQQITSEYITSLDYFSQDKSEFVRASNERIKQMLLELSPQQRQSLYFSKGYQDPATMVGEYENLRTWASKDAGRQLTMDEAWAFLREIHLHDALMGIA